MKRPDSDGPDERRRTAPLEQADPRVPYRIDWIDPRLLQDGAPGRLGLTFLPGKHGVSTRYPGLTYARSLAADLAAIQAVGVRFMVLMVEDQELRQWGEPEIVARAAELGITVDRRPLADGSAPGSLAEMSAIVETLRARRMDGDVAVACMGGVGRTGMVAACALVSGGAVDADAAIAFVRQVRHPDAVETQEQREFVRRFAAWTSDRSRTVRRGRG